MRDPQVVELTEEKDDPLARPEGPCLFCARWIDEEEADAYAVRLSKASGESSVHVCHVSCLAKAADPSAKLP